MFNRQNVTFYLVIEKECYIIQPWSQNTSNVWASVTLLMFSRNLYCKVTTQIYQPYISLLLFLTARLQILCLFCQAAFIAHSSCHKPSVQPAEKLNVCWTQFVFKWINTVMHIFGLQMSWILWEKTSCWKYTEDYRYKMPLEWLGPIRFMKCQNAFLLFKSNYSEMGHAE